MKNYDNFASKLQIKGRASNQEFYQKIPCTPPNSWNSGILVKIPGLTPSPYLYILSKKKLVTHKFFFFTSFFFVEKFFFFEEKNATNRTHIDKYGTNFFSPKNRFFGLKKNSAKLRFLANFHKKWCFWSKKSVFWTKKRFPALS